MSNPNKQHSIEPVQDNDFLNRFKKLPEKSPATIRLFDRGDYYSLHGSDAIFAAKEHFKTNNVIKTWKSNSAELETVYVNTNNFESLLKDLLLVKQYRVEIWKKSSKTFEWQMVNHGSPGNLGQFEDVLYGVASNGDDTGGGSETSSPTSDPGLISIQISSDDDGSLSIINKLVCAFVDKTTRSFLVCTIPFKDSFTDLESLLIHLSPKECLIPASGGNRDYYKKLAKCLDKTNILLTERKKTEFAQDKECAELNKLIKMPDDGQQNVGNLIELKETTTVGCLNSLIKYLNLLGDAFNDKKFKVKSYNLNNYLKLDASAFTSLNLIPSANAGGGSSGGGPSSNDSSSINSKIGSVYGVLNRCVTNQGARMLMQWIKQPLIDVHKIEERQNLVELLYNDTELRQTLCDRFLKRMPDFQKLEWRLIKKKSTLHDIYKIYCAIEQLPQLHKLLAEKIENESDGNVLIKEVFTQPLDFIMQEFVNYQEMVRSTLDLGQVHQHLFLIKASYQPELKELRDQLNECEASLTRVCEKTADELGLASGKIVKLEFNTQYGYHMRMPRKEDATLSKHNKTNKYQVMSAKKDGIYFKTSRLDELNDQFLSTREEYEQRQKSVVDEVLTCAQGYLEPLQVLNQLIAELDCYISFANVALNSQQEYVRPKMRPMGSGLVKLVNSRHPCLELQTDVNFIANDCELDKKGERQFCILTGPNMGGKSTYIRQIGILVLMAQMGAYVPASEADIGVCDAILARIGANDCQHKGVSTFMAEMLETSFILKSATSNSLVIIDELGRGTSTYDGFGLAWAISDYLLRRVGCLTLFATHFHELTALSEESGEGDDGTSNKSKVFNAHVSALTNSEALTLLYKVRPGVCDQSFGIHVAQLAQFPSQVIAHAKEKAKYLEDYSPILTHDEDKSKDDKNIYKSKQQTNQLIEECFKKISALEEGTDEQEYVNKIQKLIQQEAESSDNAYFKMLVNKL